MSNIDDIDFNMEDIIEDVTRHTIKHINSDPELYKDVKFGKVGARKHDAESVMKICYDYARAHNNEFGPLFQTELDMVDWAEVIERV